MQGDGDDDVQDTRQEAPTTPGRQRPFSEHVAAQALLTTSGAASLASASSLPPPLLSRSSIKSLATQAKDEKSTPSLHIHLNESTHQIRLSPSPSRPRSVLSTATDEGPDDSLVLDIPGELQEAITSVDTKSQDGGSAVRTAFLAKRLRSAIGDDILWKNDIHTANTKSDQKATEQSKPPIAVNTDPSSMVTKGVGDQAESSQTSSWGWSALTTLPASLRIGTVANSDKTSSKLGTGPTIKEPLNPVESPKAETKSPPTETASFGSYMKPLDVRKWWPSSSSSSTGTDERPVSSSQPSSDRRNGDNSSLRSNDNRKKNPSREPPNPLQGIPSGSFPASSIAKRNKKKRETSKHTKGKEKGGEGVGDPSTSTAKEGEGSDIAVHDLSDHQFGMVDDSHASYSEREYLVLSTAGKPIFVSHVSKARLKRAAETRARQQERQRRQSLQDADGDNNEEDDKALAAEDSALQDEEDQNAATRVGVIQALISNYESLGMKELQQRSKGILELPSSSRISFVLKPPLYLAAISRWGEDEVTLCNHLEYLYYAILSIVSASKLNRLFDRAANFDLKRLLDGTDGILDSLLTDLQIEAAPLYDSLRPLRIDAALRAEAAAALVPSKDQVRPRDALYALLVGPSGVVALAKRKRKSIHPVDCHLLINTVFATKSMKEAGTQSWVPICLPKFAPQGFLYAHVSFLREKQEQRSEVRENELNPDVDTQDESKPTSELALVLVTSNPDGFEEMSLWRSAIIETLLNQRILGRLMKAMQISNATYNIGELRLPGLRHFIFKWRSNLQSTSPRFEEPYEVNSDDQKRLICLYGIAQEYVYRRATSTPTATSEAAVQVETVPKQSHTDEELESHNTKGEAPTSPPSPIIRPKNILAPPPSADPSPTKPNARKTAILPLAPKRKPIITGQHLLKTSSEIVFAWSTSQFELYLAVGLHLPRNAIINIAKAIVKWVKVEEPRLFIASPSIFD